MKERKSSETGMLEGSAGGTALSAAPLHKPEPIAAGPSPDSGAASRRRSRGRGASAGARLLPILWVAIWLVRGGDLWAQVDYVDPGIGSIAHLLEPTRPTVSLPYSMVRMYPVRRDGTDDQIQFFPL